MTISPKSRRVGRPIERYSQAELSRLASSLVSWFSEDLTSKKTEQNTVTDHLFLMQWAIEENVPSQSIDGLAKKSSVFAVALKKAKDIQKLKLMRLMVDDPKRCVPLIFICKNIADMSDSPIDRKAAQQTLKLVVHLPDKSKPLKQLQQADRSVPAQFQVIEPAKIDSRTKEGKRLKSLDGNSGKVGTNEKPQ